jgi:hypothetical protein
MQDFIHEKPLRLSLLPLPGLYFLVFPPPLMPGAPCQGFQKLTIFMWRLFQNFNFWESKLGFFTGAGFPGPRRF